MTATRDGTRLSRGLDWLFRDRASGRLVVVQWPNLAFVVFLAARALEWALGSAGTAALILQWVGTTALLWWSVGELARGVNPFRRVLGAVVLTGLVIRLVSAAAL